MAHIIPLGRDRPAPLALKDSTCTGCAVRSIALCGALGCHEAEMLQSIASTRRLDPDDILYQEGDKRLRVYTLTEGVLRLSSLLADGRRQITGFLMPGDFLGLADDETYASDVEAVTSCTLCSFTVADMDRLMSRRPELGARLLQLTRTALRQAREGQIMLGRLAPVEKLSSFLLLLSARAEERGLGASPVHLPMSRTDIADYLGLTIETVSRSFTKLRNQGLISLTDAHMVHIPDLRALSAVAGVNPR